MWIFTKIGFFSAVEDYKDKSRVVVRSRLKEDIVNLADYINGLCSEKSEVIKTPESDYLYRITIAKTVWSEVCSKLASEIDYSNFKNSVHGNYKRDSAYMITWQAMYTLQESSKCEDEYSNKEMILWNS